MLILGDDAFPSHWYYITLWYNINNGPTRASVWGEMQYLWLMNATAKRLCMNSDYEHVYFGGCHPTSFDTSLSGPYHIIAEGYMFNPKGERKRILNLLERQVYLHKVSQ